MIPKGKHIQVQPGDHKHIEVIVRQMLRRVRVKEVGDSAFLVDEQVERHVFECAFRRIAITQFGASRSGVSAISIGA